MSHRLICFTDPETGASVQIDPLAQTRVTTMADGRRVEDKVMEEEDLASTLTTYANDMMAKRLMRSDVDRAHLMDLGVADVSTPTPLTNYASGFHNGRPIADIVSPIVLSAQPSSQYYQWDAKDAFQSVDNIQGAPGATVAEVSPRLSKSAYNSIQYALGSFVPTEVQAAADAPLRPFQNAIARVMNVLMMEREQRVHDLLANASSYAAGNKVVLAAGSQWNGGATGDPVANLMTLMENALIEPTGIAMSRRMYNVFVRSAAVQKFFGFKSTAKALPNAAEISALLELPPIYVGTMKKMNRATGVIDYIWGNDIVVFHAAPILPADGQDISTSYTFRWRGLVNPGTPDLDSAQSGQGLMVRTFFNQNRGPAGGMQVVVSHQDAEVLTGPVVGGLVTGAYV